MKTINGTDYYSKSEMADIIGCSPATINLRVIALKIKGCYLGRRKWYTGAEMEAIATYRKPHEDQ